MDGSVRAQEIQFHRVFSAAHRLYPFEGKCANIHGHNWTAIVTIYAPVTQGPGFVIEFDHIKAAIDRFDHRLLLWVEDPLAGTMEKLPGLLLTPDPPTTENLCHLFCTTIWKLLVDAGIDPQLVEVELQETENIKSVCSLTQED
jgi:6-pyruvoyltetrahydropterin/6-carboxytetrahydropterin synthase